MLTLFPASDSTFRILYRRFSSSIFAYCFGHVSPPPFPPPWYCTRLDPHGPLLLISVSAFRRVSRLQYHRFGVVSAEISVLSFSVFSRLVWVDPTCFLHFDQRPSASLPALFFLALPTAPFVKEIRGVLVRLTTCKRLTKCLPKPILTTPYYGPYFYYFLAYWFYFVCLSINGPTSPYHV